MLRIAPIVEGEGEVQAVPNLLRRIGLECLAGIHVDVLKPIRCPRSRLVENKDGELERALGLAAAKLRNQPPCDGPSFVLLLLDADDDLACELAPRLLTTMRKLRSDLDVACVLANVEFETWFVGAATSLTQYLNLNVGEPPPSPEATRSRKGWIEQRFKGHPYKETIDQPKLTAKMDLTLCRDHCRSFDKLCREMESRLAAH